MANNVHFHVTLDIDEKESKLVQFLMENISSKTSHGWMQYEIEKLPIYPTKYDEEGWYNWSIDNMGAKWCHVEDYETDYFSGYSAWSPPIPFVKHLIQYIHDELGGKPTATMTYEDEFRNFIGKTTYFIEAGECYDDTDEIDGEELNEVMLTAYGKEESWFASDDFDWWEEYELVAGSYKGEKWEPQTYCDELVYSFFDKGYLVQL
tara:strand:+ start:2306 stop:2923 length:618 start_codon:yes stop_codon:yes gene_type:complete